MKTPEQKEQITWYQKNKELVKQRTREWQKANPERYKELHKKSQAKWNKKNENKLKQYRKRRNKELYIPHPREKQTQEQKVQICKEYYKRNREAILAKKKLERAEQNKDKRQERQKIKELKQKEKAEKLARKKWRQEHPEECRKEYMEKFNKAHPNYMKEYQRKLKEKKHHEKSNQ